MQAVIDALPAIDAVIAGEAVADEEIGVVEFEALRVLVGDVGRVAADGAAKAATIGSTNALILPSRLIQG